MSHSHIRKICIHWTAGSYQRSNTDFHVYHYTVGWDGSVSSGKFKPEANIPPLSNGYYAAHCGGGNSYTIGVALRGMAGYVNPDNIGEYPLTQKQCEAAWKFCAQLCNQHDITPYKDTVFTHYEFGKRRPTSDSAGKIDISFLPHEPDLKPNEIGGYIRNKVIWYKQRG